MRSSTLRALLTGAILTAAPAFATPVQLGELPVTVEPNESLFTMSQEGLVRAFPDAAKRPAALFITEDRKVTVTFEWRTGKLNTADVPKLVNDFPAVIRTQVPNLKTLKSGTLVSGGATWAQFIYTAPGKTGELRREMLITSLKGRMLVITIAGTMRDYAKNQDVVQSLFRSVRLN